jgi:hypothetical protein
MKPFPVYLYFEMLCFLASLTLFLQKGVPRYLRSFPFCLLVMVTIELIGWRTKNRLSILWLYNLFIVVNSDYYLFLLWHFIKNSKARRAIWHSGWIYTVMALFNFFFIQVNALNTITFALGFLIIVVFCIYYFLELFQLPSSINLVRERAFWITSALLFFHCCSFMLFSLSNLLSKTPPAIRKNVHYLLDMILIMFYLLFTIAFLCRIGLKKNRAKLV